jgi:uncharacterized membrane protein
VNLNARSVLSRTKKRAASVQAARRESVVMVFVISKALARIPMVTMKHPLRMANACATLTRDSREAIVLSLAVQVPIQKLQM